MFYLPSTNPIVSETFHLFGLTLFPQRLFFYYTLDEGCVADGVKPAYTSDN